MSRTQTGGRPLALMSAALLSFALVVAIPALLAWFALPLFSPAALRALLSLRWDPDSGHFGVLAMLAGTLATALPALALSFPLAIGILALSNGLAPRPLSLSLRLLIRLMTSIPTVAWAFTSAFLLVPWIRGISQGSGYCALAVVLTLALLILPTQILIVDAALRALPEQLWLSACALGFDRTQYLLYVAFPRLRASLLAALALGFGRAIGDTMIALMVSGNAALLPGLPTESLRTLTAHIALVLATDANSKAYASLFAAGLLLAAVTFALNLALAALRRSSDEA